MSKTTGYFLIRDHFWRHCRSVKPLNIFNERFNISKRETAVFVHKPNQTMSTVL